MALLRDVARDVTGNAVCCLFVLFLAGKRETEGHEETGDERNNMKLTIVSFRTRL